MGYFAASELNYCPDCGHPVVRVNGELAWECCIRCGMNHRHWLEHSVPVAVCINGHAQALHG